MMRRYAAASFATLALLVGPSARGHELWFQPPNREPARSVRLTFGDSPAPGEAERVAEIAHAKVWADGSPLEVKRLAEGLEAGVPTPPPAILSAYADRGVIDHQGDSFVILLAAYAQSRPIEAPVSPRLGLGDDQLRLLLVDAPTGRPTIRATWRGKPVVGALVKVFRGGESTDSRTDDKGEIPCPELPIGGLSFLTQVEDQESGTRDGKSYSHTRFKATLNLVATPTEGAKVAERLVRVREIHGAAGPWAVAGYRMGERARQDLDLPKHAFSLLVVHQCPAEVQYSCVADGLQAATGASPGKLNLRVEEAKAGAMKTVIRDSKSGRALTFTLKPEFLQSVANLPFDRLETEGRRVAGLRDDEIFSVIE